MQSVAAQTTDSTKSLAEFHESTNASTVDAASSLHHWHQRQRRPCRGLLLLPFGPFLSWATVTVSLLLLLLLQSPLPTSGNSEAASAATAMLERMRTAAKAGSAASSTTAGSGAGAAAAASTPESVQSVGSSYVIQALQRHNSSGTLPSVPALNEMLRTVNGEGALQLNESFATAAAADPATTANGVFTNSVLGLSGNSAASYGVSAVPAGVASTFPSLSAVGSPGPLPGLSTTPTQLFALVDDAGGGFGLGGGGSYGAPSPEVEAGLRAIRFGIYDSLFGYLPFAGFQLLAIGNWILIKDEKTALILFAVGNELIGLGFLFIGIKGTEATDVAVRALAVIVEEEATGKPAAAATGAAAPGGAAHATALADPQGTGFTPQPPAPVPGPISSAPITSVPPPVGTGTSSVDPILGGLSGGLPFTSAAANAQTATATAAPAASANVNAGSTTPYTFLPSTAPAAAAPGAASATSGNAKVLATSLSCSSLLYGSWLRIETDAAMGAGASPPKTAKASAAQQGESVLLRFSATSFERIERVWVGDKRRTRQQHWTGSLHVECESESEGDDADWASQGVPISASGSTHVTVSMTGTGAGALLSDDSTALFFTYLPVQLSGNTNGVLVERSEFDESPSAAARRRAYIRI